MELLVVKAEGDYFRFVEDGFEKCGMNKASVYPLNELERVRTYCQKVVDSGLPAHIKKLTILEEDFSG
jgi:hypothetical protein